MSIGIRIKEFRERAGLSQGDVAKALKVTRQAVSRWEKNGQEPTDDKLKPLADILGVTIEDLVGLVVFPVKDIPNRREIRYVMPTPSEYLHGDSDAEVYKSPRPWFDLEGVLVFPESFRGTPAAVRNPCIPVWPEGRVTALIDIGAPVRSGGLALVRIYDVPKFVCMRKAGNGDFLVEDFAGHEERLTEEMKAETGFEIVGPVKEIRCEY